MRKPVKACPCSPGRRKMQGIGAGFVPGNLDLNILDAKGTVQK